MELEIRRYGLFQIEMTIKAATNREQIQEQLGRISEVTRFLTGLSGCSSSLQTAASVVSLIRENSRLYNLATRRLAELGQKSAVSLGRPECFHRPAPPSG
ncbi:MAG TPA: hypothetical protein VL486_12855 [Verrucomicrobiae bacterium]|nr:hypothetical protein [Verrucomicrobiae bacterium]